MKIYIGTDHRGVEFKKKIQKILENWDHDVIDCGTNDPDVSCDYPKIAYKVASQVASSSKNRGILLCMSGIGQAIAANKVKGAYAALCCNPEAAQLSRQHNNANVLVIGAKFVKQKDLKKIIQNFLESEFEGGRHLRRVKQMKAIENGKELR
tara:strand:- start:41 stop:496 length:456 start_codon:yes stop_codon:yes gene_type:complete